MFNKVALITGAAKRIGKATTTALHADGYDVIIHYHHSRDDAHALADMLNAIRPNSAKPSKQGLMSSIAVMSLMHSKNKRCLVLAGLMSWCITHPAFMRHRSMVRMR